MKHLSLIDWIFITCLVLISAFYFVGIHLVPFHPDESTQLFMSKDYDLLLTNPFSMSWVSPDPNSLPQHYRELDAPITRYLLGFGRSLAGIPPLPADWDWSLNWQENTSAGALPSGNLLNIGRFTITLLFPFTLIFIYLAGKKLGSPWIGLFAVLFLALNPLSLLHARRAMAEGALLFTVTLAIWALLSYRSKIWLAAVGIALAYNTKQSAAALLLPGGFAAVWLPRSLPNRYNRMIIRGSQFIGIAVLITLALSPLYWLHPIQALQSSWQARQDLVNSQVADFSRLNSALSLDTPASKLIALVAQVYFASPSFSEAGNYVSDTASQVTAYLSVPGNSLFRGFYWGGFFLFLTLLGLAFSALRIFSSGQPHKPEFILLGIAAFSQVFFILLTIPLPFQRYYIPLLPFVCLYMSYGIYSVINLLDRSIFHPGNRTTRNPEVNK